MLPRNTSRHILYPMQEKHQNDQAPIKRRQHPSLAFSLILFMIFIFQLCLHLAWIKADIPSGYSEVFQVHQPVKSVEKNHSETIMQHQFGNSWGQPFVKEIGMPSSGNDFTGVVMRLEVVGRGRQFDRIGFIFVDDIEVWRTSTLEPSANGSFSITYKDISKYQAILKRPWKLIVDIGNTVDDIYVSPFDVKLDIIYQYGQKDTAVADRIFALSRGAAKHNQSSVFSLPGHAITKLMLPYNTQRAIVEVYASGNAEEEFWYQNVPTSLTDLFPGVPMLGAGAFREIQVLIDGDLAGVVWPFAVIYTGGISPGLWRPIVAIDAFDQMTYSIDVTAFLGRLCDDKKHSISFHVDGPEHTILHNWYVSGNLQVWTSGNTRTTESSFEIASSIPRIEVAFDNHDQAHPRITTSAGRSISVESILMRERGQSTVNWTQILDFHNEQVYFNNGIESHMSQSTNGSQSLRVRSKDVSQEIDEILQYSFPLQVNSSFIALPDDGFSLSGSIVQAKRVHSTAFHDIYDEATNLVGASFYQRQSKAAPATAWGVTVQDFSYSQPDMPEYHRQVAARNGKLKPMIEDDMASRTVADIAEAQRFATELNFRSSPQKVLGHHRQRLASEV